MTYSSSSMSMPSTSTCERASAGPLLLGVVLAATGKCLSAAAAEAPSLNLAAFLRLRPNSHMGNRWAPERRRRALRTGVWEQRTRDTMWNWSRYTGGGWAAWWSGGGRRAALWRRAGGETGEKSEWRRREGRQCAVM